MKRREERKKARNALIEETTRLEAANNPEVGDRFLCCHPVLLCVVVIKGLLSSRILYKYIIQICIC